MRAKTRACSLIEYLPAGRQEASELNMYFVYVLQSPGYKRFYVGITEDVERRIGEHNSGKTKSTKFYAPWNLVFTEKFETRIEARNREKFLKGGSGKELIKRYFYESKKIRACSLIE